MIRLPFLTFCVLCAFCGDSLDVRGGDMPVVEATLGTSSGEDGRMMLSLSPDGKLVAAPDCEDSFSAAPYVPRVHVWEWRTPKELFAAKLEHRAQAVQFTPNGKSLVVADWNAKVYLFDARTGKKQKSFSPPDPPRPTTRRAKALYLLFGPDTVTYADRLVLTPDGNTIILGGDALAACNLGTAKMNFLQREEVYCLSLNPNGDVLVRGGRWNSQAFAWPGMKTLYSVSSGHSEGSWGSPVICAAFSPDGKLLVTGGGGSRAVLRDSATGKELHRLEGQKEKVNSVAFSPDGVTLATSSYDGTINLWHTDTGNFRNSLELKRKRIRPDQKVLDELQKALDKYQMKLNEADIEAVLRQPIKPDSIVFAHDGRHLLVLNNDSTISVWDLGGK